MRKLGFGLALAAALAASPARADWVVARTSHFVIYIDDTQDAARDFAMRLERFDLALRRLYNVPDDPERHASAVRVFALKQEIFQDACNGCRGRLGYYQPRTGGSVIFSAHVPSADRKAQPGSWSSQAILLHEYSHHFMYSNYPLAYPYWFSEGFAEFNANVIFEKNGAVTMGLPANYRANAMSSGGNMSIPEFFDPQQYGFAWNTEVYYGRGWLLTHYLILSPRRKGQLATYLAEMNRGRSSMDAARTAFGDLSALFRELAAYRAGVLAPPLRVSPPAQPIEVKVDPLPKGEADMLPIHAATVSGVAPDRVDTVAIRARKVAAAYPDDPVVQVQLAEAELDWNKFDQADAAADRALALRPAFVDALLIKGKVAMRRAGEAKTANAAAWSAARGWFLKANRANPNAATALYLYYLSFTAAHEKPSAGAIKGLSRAQVLSPESSEVRVALARHLLEERDAASARFLLQPIAFAPHRRTEDNVARRVIELIDAGKIEEARTAMDAKKDDKEEKN